MQLTKPGMEIPKESIFPEQDLDGKVMSLGKIISTETTPQRGQEVGLGSRTVKVCSGFSLFLPDVYVDDEELLKERAGNRAYGIATTTYTPDQLKQIQEAYGVEREHELVGQPVMSILEEENPEFSHRKYPPQRLVGLVPLDKEKMKRMVDGYDS